MVVIYHSSFKTSSSNNEGKVEIKGLDKWFEKYAADFCACFDIFLETKHNSILMKIISGLTVQNASTIQWSALRFCN